MKQTLSWLRFHLAVKIGKLVQILLRFSGTGADALPGLIAINICPDIFETLSRQCKDGVILVSGTNGKTTTCRLLSSILQNKGTIIHNRSGSNLTRGHISALLEKTCWLGRVSANTALLEVDEAVLPYAVEKAKPKLIILHNLFRDQLDRYGEVDTLVKKWRYSLQHHLPKNAQVLVNADDPNLAYMASGLDSKQVIYYGIDSPGIGTIEPVSAVDAYLSPSSQKPLQYSEYYVSHLGNYSDPEGNFKRPALDFAAKEIAIQPLDSTSLFNIATPENVFAVDLPIPGLYNVYNALAAASAGLALGITSEVIRKSLHNPVGAFGRFERLTYGKHELTLCLIKNPAGATEVLRTIALANTDKQINLVVLANDQFADGQDVSWYWDTPFEIITPHISTSLFGGDRGNDMALRCKYAGFKEKSAVIPDIAKVISHIPKLPKHHTYVLTTYTASLEVQKIFRRLGVKSAYWKE